MIEAEGFEGCCTYFDFSPETSAVNCQSMYGGGLQSRRRCICTSSTSAARRLIISRAEHSFGTYRTLRAGILTHDGGLSMARRWVLSLALASPKSKGRKVVCAVCAECAWRKLCNHASRNRSCPTSGGRSFTLTIANMGWNIVLSLFLAHAYLFVASCAINAIKLSHFLACSQFLLCA